MNQDTRETWMKLKLEGLSYGKIAKQAGVTRQRVQQVLAPAPVIKRLVARRAGYRCESCGVILEQKGHVHHKLSEGNLDDYEDVDQLMYLCQACHSSMHPHPKTSDGTLPLSLNLKTIEIINEISHNIGVAPISIVHQAVEHFRRQLSQGHQPIKHRRLSNKLQQFEKILSEPKTIHEISKEIGLSPHTISVHLSTLRKIRTIHTTQKGRRMAYQIKSELTDPWKPNIPDKWKYKFILRGGPTGNSFIIEIRLIGRLLARILVYKYEAHIMTRCNCRSDIVPCEHVKEIENTLLFKGIRLALLQE